MELSAESAMNTTMEILINSTARPRQLTMKNSLDAHADTALGFWLNGIGITFIGLMGIFGNMASIRVLSHKQMRSSVNFILIALACSDLLLIFTSILLFGLTTFYPYTGWLKAYYFVTHPKIAGIVYPLGFIAHTVSIYMTFLISLERYIAVCHPLKARSFCTQARTKLSIILIVLIAIVYNIPKFFEVELWEGVDEEFGTFYALGASDFRKNGLYINIYINWCYFIFLNLIPLSGITFFNVMIYRQVQIVNRLRMKLTSKELQDIKLTTMLFSVVTVFMTCNFLSVLTNILESFYNIHNDRLTKVSNFCVTVNSSVNFIIYVVLVKKFRLILIKQLRSLFRIPKESGKNARFMRRQTVTSFDSEQTTNDND